MPFLPQIVGDDDELNETGQRTNEIANKTPVSISSDGSSSYDEDSDDEASSGSTILQEGEYWFNNISYVIRSPVVFSGPGNDRDCESPPSNPIRLVVHADVHHELNWSPTSTVRPPKRQACGTVCVSSPKRMNHNEIIERESQLHVKPISFNNCDSGISCDEIGTLSSISEHSTMPSIGEMPSRF